MPSLVKDCFAYMSENKFQFGMVLFFGALLVYTFKILTISIFIYVCLIPVSYFHYKKIKKEKNVITDMNESDDLEDIL